LAHDESESNPATFVYSRSQPRDVINMTAYRNPNWHSRGERYCIEEREEFAAENKDSPQSRRCKVSHCFFIFFFINNARSVENENALVY